MDVTVWANSRTSPIKTCEDAKLRDAPTLLYPAGNNHGQAGWDIGLLYQDAGDLGRRLGDVREAKGRVGRLSINSHGAPGVFDLDGSNPASDDQNERLLNVKTMGNRFNSQLGFIKMQLAPNATVLFMGCNLGQGQPGSVFLETLSKTLFQDILVVAFTTTGVSMQQYRAGERCTEPGMRDTSFDNPASSPSQEAARYQNGALFSLPWAAETSAHAKTAKNGVILKNPDAPQSFGPEYIVGKWDVEIGSWSGLFAFESTGGLAGRVYWMDNTSMQKHEGFWSVSAGAVSWQFTDDPPSFKRTFMALIPLMPTVNGSILPSGVYKMMKRD